MTCCQCKSSITGKYHRLDQYEKVYCHSCYTKGRKCHVCTLPADEIYLVDNYKVCSDCYSQRFNCRSCSRDLKKEDLFVIPGLQGFFCKSCKFSTIRCSRCGFPGYAQENFLDLEQNFRLCESCQSSSVLSEDIGKNILVNISRILNAQMGLQVVKNISLNLINKKEMRRKWIEANTYSDEEESCMGVTIKDGSVSRIYILNGLALSHFISVVTQEYSKIWQMKYCSKHLGQVLWDGITNWTAVKMLGLLGYHEEIRKIEENENTVGFGLRKIKVIEKSKGTKGVVELMTQAK